MELGPCFIEELLAQAVVVKLFEQLGHLALRRQPVEKSVEKLRANRRHKHFFTLFLEYVLPTERPPPGTMFPKKP